MSVDGPAITTPVDGSVNVSTLGAGMPPPTIGAGVASCPGTAAFTGASAFAFFGQSR